MPLDDLGSHVRRRADQGPGDRHSVIAVDHLGDAEVGQLDHSIVSNHHVLGLEIAVNHACLMRVPQRGGDLVDQHRGDFRRIERVLAGVLRQGLPVDVFGHDVRVGRVLCGEIENLQDVGMSELCDRFGLPGQSPARILLARQVGVENLDRHLSLQGSVQTPVNHAHPA